MSTLVAPIRTGGRTTGYVSSPAGSAAGAVGGVGWVGWVSWSALRTGAALSRTRAGTTVTTRADSVDCRAGRVRESRSAGAPECARTTNAATRAATAATPARNRRPRVTLL